MMFKHKIWEASMSAKAGSARKSKSPTHPLVKQHFEAVQSFIEALKQHQKIFNQLQAFSEIKRHNDQILLLLKECSNYLLNCEKELELENFEEALKNEYAEGLQDLLDHPPSPVPRKLQTDDVCGALLDDFDEFYNRVYEATIRNDGYKLYHVLTGAA
jgi:uncharacterized protein YeeX (DUF496 family)